MIYIINFAIHQIFNTITGLPDLQAPTTTPKPLIPNIANMNLISKILGKQFLYNQIGKSIQIYTNEYINEHYLKCEFGRNTEEKLRMKWKKWEYRNDENDIKIKFGRGVNNLEKENFYTILDH